MWIASPPVSIALLLPIWLSLRLLPPTPFDPTIFSNLKRESSPFLESSSGRMISAKTKTKIMFRGSQSRILKPASSCAQGLANWRKFYLSQLKACRHRSRWKHILKIKCRSRLAKIWGWGCWMVRERKAQAGRKVAIAKKANAWNCIVTVFGKIENAKDVPALNAITLKNLIWRGPTPR